MVIHALGTVRDGVIVPEPGVTFPEGVQVTISADVEAPEKSPNATLAEAIKLFAGKAKGLPSDLSLNHDHYLYGTPKK